MLLQNQTNILKSIVTVTNVPLLKTSLTAVTTCFLREDQLTIHSVRFIINAVFIDFSKTFNQVRESIQGAMGSARATTSPKSPSIAVT